MWELLGILRSLEGCLKRESYRSEFVNFRREVVLEGCGRHARNSPFSAVLSILADEMAYYVAINLRRIGPCVRCNECAITRCRSCGIS